MIAETTSPSDVLSQEEACAYVRVSLPTLLSMVRKHRTPRIEIGKRKIGKQVVPALVKYRRGELDRMLEKSSKQMR